MALKAMTERQQHLTVFFALWAGSLLICWRSFVEIFSLSLQTDEYTYILLILPVSTALILLERRSLSTMAAFAIRPGAGLLAGALAIALCMRVWSARVAPDVHLSMTMLALVLAWIGSFVVSFGLRASRSALFPLLFLFGMVPLPRPLLDAVIALLQQGSAWTAHGLFTLVGVPVNQSGVFLTIPDLTVQVSQECSSIRSSSMLLVTTLVLAEVLLRTRWHKALVIALAIPLSIAKNGLRIFVIAMLGTRVDPGYLTGRLHHHGGIVFFLVALIGIFVLICWFQRQEGAVPSLGLKAAKATVGGD
jgi:exosortase